MKYLKINEAKLKIEELVKILDSVRNNLNQYDENKVFQELNKYINEKGIFTLLDPSEMPGDARQEFIWLPTYRVITIIGHMVSNDKLNDNNKTKALEILSKFSTTIRKYGIYGHGYDVIYDIRDSIKLMYEDGLFELINNDLPNMEEFNRSLLKLSKQLIRDIEHEENIKVFVYGTLVKGGRLHPHLENSTFIGDAALNDYALYNVTDWYPGILPKNNSRVIGEVYSINEDKLAELDIVEGEGSLYKRIYSNVTLLDSNAKCKVYTYKYMGNINKEKNKIKSGIWREKRVKYFGYGSCMKTSDFLRSTRDDGFNDEEVKVLGVATLKGYELEFTYKSCSRHGGVLDIIENPNCDVLGVLFEVPYKIIEKSIDKREGHPNIYRRIELKVEIEGKSVSAFTYKVNDSRRQLQGVKPTEEYANIAYEGMKEHGFEEKYVNLYINKLKEKYGITLE